MNAPYDAAAERYLDAGLWPIPVIGKNPPVSGATGYEGTVTREKISAWLSGSGRLLHGKPADNVALRHQKTLAIDVDQGYGDKDGVAQLAEFARSHGLPPLPPTWSSTARGPESASRQYLYRIDEDVRLKTKPCASVEICNWHHRFTVCWPSTHPDTGGVYTWYLPGDAGTPPTWGSATTEVPSLGDFAPLPEAWLGVFHSGSSALDPSAITVPTPELLGSFTEGEPDAYVSEQLDRWANGDNHLGHDETKNALVHAFMLGREGHVGVHQLVGLVLRRFSEYVSQVRPQEAEREIESLVKACSEIAQQKLTEEDKWARLGVGTVLRPPATPPVLSFSSMDSGPPTFASESQMPRFEGFESEIQGAQPSQNGQAPSSEDFEYRFLAGQLAPTPLPGLTEELPLPTCCPELANYVSELADALQVPRDMPTTMALTLLATAAKGGWEVVVQPGWLEPLSICALVCQGSGERKSPALRALEAPLRDFQTSERAAVTPAHRTQETKAQLARKRYESAMSRAGRSEDPDAESEVLRLYDAWQVAQGAVTPLPTWTVGADGTPEAFVDLLVKHRALGIITAEPGLFGILGGRYSSGSPNIEWFLHATAGEPLDGHRIGRDAGSVDRPVLSALSCIQPGRLRELGEKPEFRASGLLARHLFCIAPTMLGRRERTRDIDPALSGNWSRRIVDLLKESKKINLGSTNSSIRYLHCSPEAAEVLASFEDELEPELTPHTGRYSEIGDWIGKATGTAARIAGLLALFNDPGADAIDVDVTRDAVALVRGYISHTSAAFGLTDPAADVTGHAQEVLSAAQEVSAASGQPWFTRRDVHQKIRGRKWARRAEALDLPIELLSAHGFIVAPESDAKATPGRPPERYLLNPAEPRSRIAPARPRTPRDPSSKSSQTPPVVPQTKVSDPGIATQNPQNGAKAVPAQPKTVEKPPHNPQKSNVTQMPIKKTPWPPCRECGSPLYFSDAGRDVCGRCVPTPRGTTTTDAQLVDLGLLPAPADRSEGAAR